MTDRSDNYDSYFRVLKQAQKDGERSITGYTGRTPDDTLADLTTGLPAGQIWVRINGEADPYNALYEDPSVKQPNTPIKLIFDFEADSWVAKSINASVAIYDAGGTTAPVFALYPHDHLTDITGGDLGANSVGNTQLQALSVAEGNIQAGAVTNSKIGADAVEVDNVNNLSASTNGIVAQISAGTFKTLKNNWTATTAPTTTNDSTEGYDVGSMWLDTVASKVWYCEDATASSASWLDLTDTGTIPDHTHDGTAGSGGLLGNDVIVPTMLDNISGASTAFVTQSASDTFSSINYTFTSNERLLYDGTDIRNAYKYYEVTTNALTTSSTTELVMWTSPDMASVIDTTNSTLLVTAMFAVRETTSAPSSYEFYLKYNYDNGGAEAWENIDPTRTPVAITRLHTNTVNYDIPVSLSVPFDPSMTGGVGFTAWGYSGTYKLRFSLARDTGTGTLLIFSGNDFTRTFGIWEQ